MSLQRMVDAHPQVDDRTEELVLAARHAMLCSLFCTSCADACVAEDMDMAQCIRNCLDCADVCAATARLATRRTAQNIDVLRSQLETCIKACETCAEECSGHDNPHCQLCAEMCRECAEDCRKALPLVN
ncbi:four-helix bundle copper-binding protein [Qipengyuania vesicularis]|uniref:four-helix bundle copper-binding protein n=1 Tax=Qipengyuania vesicularis TaxID=2867232 RepID=UPI001C877772|nr:four-helix bundle copper-binding protein [Qipengyuania vesicularis]MBX7527406.1 four-helix bundle copper-binding protein [Qipengyuania vesicularis]